VRDRSRHPWIDLVALRVSCEGTFSGCRKSNRFADNEQSKQKLRSQVKVAIYLAEEIDTTPRRREEPERYFGRRYCSQLRDNNQINITFIFHVSRIVLSISSHICILRGLSVASLSDERLQLRGIFSHLFAALGQSRGRQLMAPVSSAMHITLARWNSDTDCRSY